MNKTNNSPVSSLGNRVDTINFTTTIPAMSSISPSQLPTLIVTGWHRTHLLDFAKEHNIPFHPDYSWKTFIILMAKFIVNGRETEIIFTHWKKLIGGQTALFIKLSTMEACNRGFDILANSKAFLDCLIELKHI
ncbi:hypothetical protein L873DRAFT_1236322 [Choiromyces venosus 120613-1]|uniref:Uncharacterized protein n=1 Tax=Choiromyces venosus 120613-1 TaxID=1336337 RepID=A0A3N4JDH8_9PEZI|nr:hypothetical protein L873DRAFT_1236322 [Choiromyces venosus 120613-1]